MNNSLLLWLFESSMILGAFAIVYQCFLRGLTFFELNRVYLILSIVCSFLLPFVAISYVDNLFSGFVASQELNINLTFEALQSSIVENPDLIVEGENAKEGFSFPLLLQILFLLY